MVRKIRKRFSLMKDQFALDNNITKKVITQEHVKDFLKFFLMLDDIEKMVKKVETPKKSQGGKIKRSPDFTH